MAIIGMTVADLIEHLRDLPQGRTVFLGEEPLTKENLVFSNTKRGPAIDIKPTDGYEKSFIADFAEEDACEHADECMHFKGTRSSRRRRNLAQIYAANAASARH